MKLNRLILLSLLPVLLPLLSACIGGKSPPSEFYLLEPIKGGVGDASAGGETARLDAIALTPVRMPHYVDRPQMVTATGKNAYTLNETHRWAEPLDGNITSVLAQNLGLLILETVVLPSSSARAKQAKLRVSVDILEFHIDPQGQALLSAQWNIARGEDTVLIRQSGYHEPASATDYRKMAEALNECLTRLSRDIALSLRDLAVEVGNNNDLKDVRLQ